MIREARRDLTLFAVEKNKIDVGTVIKLTTAKFAECENGKFCGWATVALPEFRIPIFEYPANTNLRDLRKLTGCFLKRRGVGEFSERDSHHLATLPEAQGPEIFARD